MSEFPQLNLSLSFNLIYCSAINFIFVFIQKLCMYQPQIIFYQSNNTKSQTHNQVSTNKKVSAKINL